MSEDKDRFRSVMSHFATGVTIVTGVEPEGGPVGLGLCASFHAASA